MLREKVTALQRGGFTSLTVLKGAAQAHEGAADDLPLIITPLDSELHQGPNQAPQWMEVELQVINLSKAPLGLWYVHKGICLHLPRYVQ